MATAQAQRDEPAPATLYRMVFPDHLCPHGLKARWLLARHGIPVDDRPLESRAEVEAFKVRHAVQTTPQVFLNGERIGGYDDLRAHLARQPVDPTAVTYRPVIAIFAVCALLAIAVASMLPAGVFSVRTVELFAAFAMTVLGIQKLQDVERFSTMFLGYDLLARQRVGYSYLYPFAETGAGLLMVAGGLWGLLAAPVALAIGAIGALSVYKAVYVEQRTLRCACVGGDSRVPLGFVSLTENLVMIAMGLWMPIKTLL